MIEFDKVYNMDNLTLLKQMDDKSVDLIYCDILYNTGRQFKDYNDDLGTPQEAIEWYAPRLMEMKRVLKDSGSIYLQCDYRLVHYLKVYMDTLFGIKQFKNDIIWGYTSASNCKKYFPRKHDNILFYTKTDNYVFNIEPTEVRIPYKDNTIKRSKTKGGFNNDREDYLKKNSYLAPDFWTDIFFLKSNILYNTQKPKGLLARIIHASSNEHDVVADFFCGSGTSMVVAKELGRQYIGCDINPRAIEITNKRLEEIKNTK